MPDIIGTDVDVYFNLHKRLWSVRDRKTRRVVAHLDGITLSDVTFKVSAAGNERVRAEGRKNVHAFARGTVVATVSFYGPSQSEPATFITYNPYENTTFVRKDTGTPIHTAPMAWLGKRTVLALTPAQVDGMVEA
jgi:hypothetical protein